MKNKNVKAIELVYHNGKGGISSIWLPKSVYDRKELMNNLVEYEDRLIGR